MKFNKLVRDKIPELIQAGGKTPLVRILNDDEYTFALERKLDEEVGEFRRDRNLEELADILEVVYALTENLGYSKEDLLECNQRKHAERGGFRTRVFLISNEG